MSDRFATDRVHNIKNVYDEFVRTMKIMHPYRDDYQGANPKLFKEWINPPHVAQCYQNRFQ